MSRADPAASDAGVQDADTVSAGTRDGRPASRAAARRGPGAGQPAEKSMNFGPSARRLARHGSGPNASVWRPCSRSA